MNRTLQFGIPSFDALFGREHPLTEDRQGYDYKGYGIHLQDNKETTSLCFIGPDGTGKSVFGLHLAAQYVADIDPPSSGVHCDGEKRWSPRVLYVSTDLKHHVADIMWRNFGLHKPNGRDFPFHWGYRRDHAYSDREVMLARLDPAEIQSVVLDESFDARMRVHFVDLVSKTMGDDWGFINRLLAVLKRPAEGCAPHLLIVDAVEGFETLVGEQDAFGETTSRRARIAQIMRTAGEKCHVCFIVEEPKAEERFPEEFVTDVVVRLRSVNAKNYTRRTLEILKARGQTHVRGQHPFVIRGKSGSTTGLQENADDPEVQNSYVHVFPSLHYLSREEMKARGPSNPEKNTDRVAAFGITYLDEMLSRLSCDTLGGLDDQGLPAQTTTALIGEIATQKTSLATAFLARTFRAFTFHLAEVLRELKDVQNMKFINEALTIRAAVADVIRGTNPAPELSDRVNSAIQNSVSGNVLDVRKVLEALRIPFKDDFNFEDASGRVQLAAWLAEALPDNGAAVLITTSDQDRSRLVSELDGWLRGSRDKALQDWPSLSHPLDRVDYSVAFREAVRKHVEGRTICRRLELHDLSSAILFHIVQRSVEAAQERVLLSDHMPRNIDRLPSHRKVRFMRSWNIRVVVDDLSTLKDTYPDIGSDPLFLPFLLSFLELEGVTSLIIDSHIGRPDAIVTDAFDHELRALVPHKLLTWRVPFFGGIRDAITVVPPYPSGLPSLVREVRWEAREGSPNALVVDPELELYRGLEKGDPEPIPLEVRLYAETEPTKDYIREENEIFGQIFTPLGSPDPNAKAIIGVEAGQYDALRDFCNLQTDAQLNHTMIFQVDEFWATDRGATGVSAQFPRGPVSRREGALYPLGRYLSEPTSAASQSGKLVPDRVADPYGVFQGEPSVISKGAPREGPWERRHYFTRSAQGRSLELKLSELAKVDRVPYTWDFGFLLCPQSMWELASGRDIGYKNKTVGDVWGDMPNVLRRNEQPYVSWRTFLGACKAVAHTQAERTPHSVRTLDVSMLSEETFCCLVLEIWASEILDMLPPNEQVECFSSFGHIDWESPGRESLIDWLTNIEYLLAFYKTWLLLTDTLTFSDFIERRTVPRLRAREVEGSAAATRHWYKTACGHQQCPVTNEPALPVRLPGHFSTRGDWFLAVAGGSRSERLARRALDLLSTHRANFRRLELGIGLPTRDVSSINMFDHLPTALVKHDQQGRTTPVAYGELIGARIERRDHFRWFWRSQLRDYHRHSRLLQRWMGQMVAKWDDLRNQLGAQWKTGFEIYDSLEGKRAAEAKDILRPLDSWNEFVPMCWLLEEQLRIASRVQYNPEAESLVKLSMSAAGPAT